MRPTASLLLCLSLCAVAFADPPRLRLQNADLADAARELTRVTGAPVETRGGAGRRLTLELDARGDERLVREVAAALNGTWKLKLRVGGSGSAIGTSLARLDRPVTLTIEDVPAERAFRILARELRAELEVRADLSRRVTLHAQSMPLREALRQGAEQSGASWSVAYEITAPDAPKLPAPLSQPATPAAPKPHSHPAAAAPPPAPSAAALKSSLSDALQQVVRSGPQYRDEAVRAFTRRAGELLQPLTAMPPQERAERLRLLQPLAENWRRLHQGLAPDVQRQTAPITELLDRYLR